MPIKTQMRLAQLTGSIGSSAGQVDDGLLKSAKADINASDLSTILSHMAAGIQRIHGQSDFSNSDAGHFHHNLHVTGSAIRGNQSFEIQADDGASSADLTLGTTAGVITVQSAGAAVFRIEDGAGSVTQLGQPGQQDTAFGHDGASSFVEVFRVDASDNSNAGSLLMSGQKPIQFGDTTAAIHRGSSAGVIKIKGDGSDVLEIGTAVTASTALVSDTDYAQDLGSSSLRWGELFVGQVNATGLTGSLAGTGITNDQVVVSNNGTLEGDANFTWNGTLLTLGGASQGTSQLSVSGDATITGDLTVNGTTTTVNSTNMTVDDAIILLGQGNTNNTKDLGMVLERGGSNIALFLDETDDVFKFQFTTETAADDEITATDGKLAVQVDKLQITGSNSYIELADNGGGELLNIVSNRGIIIDSDAGQIFFSDLSAQTTDGVAIEFDMSTDQELAVKSGDGTSTFLTFDSANTRSLLGEHLRTNGSKKIQFRDGDASLASATTAGELVYSGSSSLIIANTTTSNSGLLKIQKDSAFVGFDFDGSTSVTYSWPDAPAQNNYVLQAQTNGTLAWVAQGGASAAIKQNVTVTKSAGFAANDAVAFSTAADFEGTPGALDVSSVDASNRLNAIDVFVNGQLLVSGTTAPGVNVDGGDYVLVDVGTVSDTDADLKFAFGIEADDVISVIIRA